ncbi:ATP-binding protein [Streptomyces sp. NPDC007984]|uniref:ATP-binding protein n=1 Tax=Streptomyces sp. NPDC007984 TaxID=3364801 RepID=UPI0036EBDEE4
MAKARRITRAVLSEWSVNEAAVVDATVIVSELVTNAVEHALPPVALHLQHHRAAGTPVVRIAVTDGGPAATKGPWVSSCRSEEHGRGSSIVATLAHRSGTRGGSNRAYWADVPAA